MSVNKIIIFLNKFYIIMLFFLFFCKTALAKSFGHVNNQDMIMLLFILSICVLMGFSYYAIYYIFNLHKKMTGHKKYYKKFAIKSKNAGLTQYEATRLKKMIVNQKNKRISDVFTNQAIFEKSFHAEAEKLIKQKLSPKDRAKEIRDLELIRIKLGYDSSVKDRAIFSSRNLAQDQKGTLLAKRKNTKELEAISKDIMIVDNNPFFISFKTGNKNIMDIIKPGRRLYFSFTIESNGTYSMPVNVTDSSEEDVFRASHTLKLEKKQLRKTYRVDLKELPMHIKLSKRISHSNKVISPVGEAFKGFLCDISGGGFCFKAERSLCESDDVKVSFKLEGEPFKSVEAKIVRIVKIKGNSSSGFKHHAKFLKLTQQNRERIIKYIFNQQRKNRRIEKMKNDGISAYAISAIVSAIIFYPFY